MAVEVAVEDAVAVDVAVAVGETVARGVAVTGIATGVDRGVPAAFETAPTALHSKTTPASCAASDVTGSPLRMTSS